MLNMPPEYYSTRKLSAELIITVLKNLYGYIIILM